MKGNRRMKGMQLTLVVFSACVAQATHAEATPEIPFKYSDEWSLVSAPPPAGPYQPVNIDPRVPGPGTIPQLPMAMPPLQATQEPPAEGTIQAESAAGAPADLQGDIVRASSGESVMPPVPGHYQPVMPLTGEEAVVETVAGESLPASTGQAPEVDVVPGAGESEAPEAVAMPGPDIDQPAAVPAPEPVAESPLMAEQVPAPALPATPDTGIDQPVAEAGAGQLPETPAAAAPMGDALAAGEEPLTSGEDEPALAETADEQLPGSDLAESAVVSPVDQLQQAQEVEVPAPPVARGGMPLMPVPDRPAATAMQPQPYERAQPEFYDQYAPPAAGHAGRQPPIAAPGPTMPLREQPAERAPATGYYGYGRSMPAPGYGYPGPGYQSYPYQSGRPGYWNMPPYGYGYPPVQDGTGEQDVPPPTVYDSTQYPRNPLQGYR